MMDDNYYMRLAIAVARVGISKGNSPFGACIVSPDGDVIASGYNIVCKTNDPTDHAEIITIKKATKHLPPCMSDLKDCTIYSTTESCLMCFGAIHWAKIKKIVYGVSLNVPAKYGFNELKIYNKQLKEITGSKIEIISNVLEDECIQLFKDWAQYHGET